MNRLLIGRKYKVVGYMLEYRSKIVSLDMRADTLKNSEKLWLIAWDLYKIKVDNILVGIGMIKSPLSN